MSVSHVSTSNVIADGTSFSASVTATSGNRIFFAITWNPDGARTVGTPAWNGQNLTQIESNITTAGGLFALYSVVASASATANLTSTYSDYIVASASIVVASTTGTGTLSAIQSQLHSSGTYAAPSLTITSAPTNCLALSFLQANSFDKDFNDVSATTWAESQTLRSTYTNASSWRVHQFKTQSAAGAGSNLTFGWTESAGAPMYTHVVLYLNDAPAESVDTITSSIQHGGSGTFTYTGLGTITAMTVHGVNVPTVSGTGGSGTFTMPSRVDGATIAGHGSKTVVITGTLASASTTMIVAEAAAQQYIAITSLGTGVGALATYYAILTTDEITSDTPATLGVVTSNIGADTLIHTDYTGTQTLWWWKASNKVVTQITMINGVVTLGGLTRAGITGAITTSGITS